MLSAPWPFRQMASVEETHTFSSALVNTVRAGISRVRGTLTLRSGTGAGVDSSLAVALHCSTSAYLSLFGFDPLTAKNKM